MITLNKIIIIKFNIAYLFVYLLLFFIPPVAHSQTSLVFNVTGQPPLNTKKYDGFMDEVTREALKRIGYNLKINRLPAERGLHSINKGIIDGEMSRVIGLDKKYTNLIHVPESIMTWDFVVFSKKEINLKNGWVSLNEKNVSFINGWKILEKNIPQSAKITKTKNSQQLFQLLSKNRTDYIIYERWGGYYLIDKMQLVNIKSIEPALSSKKMYIYLHKKHAAIVPELSKALTDMKNDGSYTKIINKHLNGSSSKD